MFPKVIVSFVFLAEAIAARPRVSLRMPPFLSPFSPQVIGGEEAPPHSYPYIVSLQYFGQHYCAGSILNEQWIMTAGHCIQRGPSTDSITVKAGKHNIKINENSEQTVEVVESFVHENYQGFTASPYDIGLLKLASPLKLTKEVQAIELAPPESEPTGEAWLCGWGSISSSRIPEKPAKLQHVKVKYINRDTCYEAILRLTGSSLVHETNVCTGSLDHHNTTSGCNGDSGGPLISRNGEKVVQTGIVSWGVTPCGTADAPSVYTRTSKFNNWIAQKTYNHSNSRQCFLNFFQIFIFVALLNGLTQFLFEQRMYIS